MAKGLTNGVIPMGAVMVRDEIYDTFMHGPKAGHRTVSRLYLFGSPGCCRRRASPRWTPMSKRAPLRSPGPLKSIFENELHSLADHPLVTDIRNFGLMGGMDLVSRAGCESAPARAGNSQEVLLGRRHHGPEWRRHAAVFPVPEFKAGRHHDDLRESRERFWTVLTKGMNSSFLKRDIECEMKL